jgi:hypothetical protein
MLCVRCGTTNFDYDTVCIKCGAALPRIPQLLKLPGQKRGHLEMLQKACADYSQGSITADDLGQVLFSIQEKVEASADTLRAMELSPINDAELKPLLDEEYSTALEGTEMMLEAIAEIAAYMEHFDQENYLRESDEHTPQRHFETGLSMASTATEILNRSIDLGHEVDAIIDLRKDPLKDKTWEA